MHITGASATTRTTPSARGGLRASIAVLAALTAALLGGSAAAAATPSTTPVVQADGIPAGAVITRLEVVGFDAQVAAAHGYRIVRTASGRLASIAGSRTVHGFSSARPANVVGGDCGISYVYEYGIGNRAIELYTGLHVNHAVVSGHWEVRLSDRGGVSFRNYGIGVHSSGIWQIDKVIGGLTTGAAQAKVVSTGSFVVLINGSVCYSGGPSDSTVIT